MRRTTIRPHRRRLRTGVSFVRRHNRTLDLPSKADLRFKEKFNTRIQIIVPSTTNKTEKISNEAFQRHIVETQHLMLRWLKGHTTAEDRGGYYSADLNKNIEENVAVVTAYTTMDEYRKNDQNIRAWLEKKCREWGQESVAYTFMAPGYPLRSFLIFG